MCLLSTYWALLTICRGSVRSQCAMFEYLQGSWSIGVLNMSVWVGMCLCVCAYVRMARTHVCVHVCV